MPLPDPGIQHPQIVVDLGDRADRRPRVAAARLLLDRDRRDSARRSGRPRAWASGPRTGGHSSKGSRRTGAGLRHKACQMPASSCPSPTRPSGKSIYPAAGPVTRRADYARARPESRCPSRPSLVDPLVVGFGADQFNSANNIVYTCRRWCVHSVLTNCNGPTDLETACVVYNTDTIRLQLHRKLLTNRRSSR